MALTVKECQEIAKAVEAAGVKFVYLFPSVPGMLIS